MLTCFGSLSRNRTVGKRIGQGETVEQILLSMKEVAEGGKNFFFFLLFWKKIIIINF
jgi:glycerol-3-phosphate dehydrogenase